MNPEATDEAGQTQSNQKYHGSTNPTDIDSDHESYGIDLDEEGSMGGMSGVAFAWHDIVEPLLSNSPPPGPAAQPADRINDSCTINPLPHASYHVMDMSEGQKVHREKKKRKSTGYRKAPQAPRRFKSPYILFSISKMQEYKKTATGTMDVTAMSRTVAKEWKNLPAEERQRWDEAAELDKIRYEQEKEAYTGPWQISSKRSPKDPSAPKRPPSAFLLYCKTERSALKRHHPGLKNTEISVLLGKKWKEELEEKRRPYVEHEKVLRRAYKERTASWKASRKEVENFGKARLPSESIALEASIEVPAQADGAQGNFSPAPTLYSQPRYELQMPTMEFQNVPLIRPLQTQQHEAPSQSSPHNLADSLVGFNQIANAQQSPLPTVPPASSQLKQPPASAVDQQKEQCTKLDDMLGASSADGENFFFPIDKQAPIDDRDSKPSAKKTQEPELYLPHPMHPSQYMTSSSFDLGELYGPLPNQPHISTQSNANLSDTDMRKPEVGRRTASQEFHPHRQMNPNPVDQTYSNRDYQLMMEWNAEGSFSATVADPDSHFRRSQPNRDHTEARNLSPEFRPPPPPQPGESAPVEESGISDHQKQLWESYRKAMDDVNNEFRQA